MRKLLLSLAVSALAFLAPAEAANYNATPGSGLIFGSNVVGGVNYNQIDICDPVTPAQCVAVNASGQITIANTTFAATQSGTWNIGSITTLPSLVAGSAIIGKVGIDQTTPGTTNLVAAGQNGTWNITNISGTVSLPTGAATSANQPTNAAIASTTSGQTGNLQFGAVTTAAPTYTTGQSNPLSLSTTGALRVDGSGVTQPVSLTSTTITGSVAVTNAGTFAVQLTGATNNINNISGTVSLPTGAATAALQPTNAAQGSTTSGQTGPLMQAAVTTAAPTYTTAQTSPLNMTTGGALRVADSSVVTALGTPFQAGGSIGNTTFAATQATAANLNATVVGTGTFAVQAAQSGTWNITNISGTVSLPTGAATSANQQTNVTAGSTTSGQTGGLEMAAVTTAAPTYTTGQSNFLSLTTAGGLRVDASATTQPVSGTVTAAQATAANLNATVTPNAGSSWGLNTTTQNSTSATLGTMALAQFNTAPTTITSGNMSPLQLDSAGNLLVNIKAGAAAGGTSSNFSATFPTAGTAAGAEYLSSPPTLTSGQMVALQVTSAGSLHTTVDNTNSNGSATSANSAPVVIASDQAAVAVKGSTANGSAVANAPVTIAGNGSGNVTQAIQCDSTIVYDASTTGSTQLVALTSGKTIYVCGYAITNGSTATNVKLNYGTGTACATGTTAMTPAYQLVANGGIVDHSSNFWGGMKTAASNALCINASAANPVQAVVYYTQF